MHKLVDYICDELDELERKEEQNGKLSMAEIEYVDLLAHAKKNLLKGEDMMDSASYREPMMYSRARRRDRMGRYSSDMGSIVESIYGIMDELPEDTKREAHKFVKKLERGM